MLNKSRKKFSLSVFLGYQFEENLANDLWMKLLKLYNNYFRNFKARNFQEVQIVFQLPMANQSPKSFWIVVISGFFYQYKLKAKISLDLRAVAFCFQELMCERRFSSIPYSPLCPYLCHLLFSVRFLFVFLFTFEFFSATHMRTALLVATPLNIS